MAEADELITNDENYLQSVKRALSMTLRQAESNYSFVRLGLDEFTEQEYRKRPQEVQTEWRLHSAGLEHPISQYLIRDIDATPDDGYLEAILGSTVITRGRLTSEMQKIYTSLKILIAAFEQLAEYRKGNSSRMVHNRYDNMEVYNSINRFIFKIQQYENIDLEETIEAMRILDIPTPNEVIIEKFVPKPPAPEWVCAKEHLIVMQYLRGFYQYVLKSCGGAE